MAGFKRGGERRDDGDDKRRAALSHPLRNRILRLMLGGDEAGKAEIAAELDEPQGRIAYHLRVLVRHEALEVVPKCRPTPPHYRRPPDGDWFRKMLEELAEQEEEGGEGGEFGGLSP
jgi:DNA-binding transcriptional ArsR family regulator